MSLNVFRVIADLSHTVSKGTLIWAIHANASAEGVSLITQILYATVFCTRYIDLFWSHPFSTGYTNHTLALGIWNFFLKIFYILSSFYIIFIMMKIYARTHESGKAWKLGYGSLAGSLLLAPFTMLIFQSRLIWSFWEFLWQFSEILEAVCVLPQLLLLRQTSVPTVIDSFYLVTLGSYRFFYIPNWILLAAQGHRVPAVSLIFGIIQTALYVDFAWVYYTRQRVKLRNGAIVDSEDFSRGWLVNKILSKAGFKGAEYDGPVDGGRRDFDAEQGLGAEEDAADRQRPVGSHGGWGKRGVSVSADDDLQESTADGASAKSKTSNNEAAYTDERQGMLQNLDDEDAPDESSEWK